MLKLQSLKQLSIFTQFIGILKLYIEIIIAKKCCHLFCYVFLRILSFLEIISGFQVDDRFRISFCFQYLFKFDILFCYTIRLITVRMCQLSLSILYNVIKNLQIVYAVLALVQIFFSRCLQAIHYLNYMLLITIKFIINNQ